MMPTAGEANIRPTNHYNLRNKPLPKTKPVVKKKRAGEKENIPEKPAPTGPVTRSRSKIPISTNHSSKTNKGREQKPKRKGVPDFAKLHKQWQDKFEKGKAVNKKTCTQVQEFDLTRPGTHFKQTYYNGQTEDNAEDFKEDHEALESILNEEGISENATRGYRNTIATTGTHHAASTSTRKTLGLIPVSKSYRPNNADNLAHSTTKEKNKQENDALKKSRKSLAQQQQEMGIEFEEDLGALASILNNTGLSHTRAVPTQRQTFASSRGAGGARASLFGGQPQSQKRTSIYYQPQASTKDAYEDYTRLVMRRLTTGDNGKPILPNRSSVHQPSTSVRTSIYRAALPTGVQQQQSTKARPVPTSTMKSTPGRVHISQPSKPTGSTQKTPMTASRVPNPHFHSVLQKQEITSSPLLSGSRQMPESHLRTPATQKKVQWADDTIGIPSAEELAQSLFTDQTEPIAKAENRIMQQMEKYKEIEKLEKQLELEIQMLSDLGDLGESKISGKGASVDVHHREDLVGRTGVDRDQQHPLSQVPVSAPRHPLSNDMVTSTERFTNCANPLQNHGTGEVQSRPPSSSQTAWSQPGENLHQWQYQLPATGGMSSSRNDRYTGTLCHQNPINGYSQTSVGLKSLEGPCAVGKPGTLPDHLLQQAMLVPTRYDPINKQCTNLVGCNLEASAINIPKSGLGATSNRHHQVGQSVPSIQGLNGYIAGVCSGHLIHSSENAATQQMCSQCNMNKPSQLQENLMLAKPIVTVNGDKLGSIPLCSVEHSATSAFNQPGWHQTVTQAFTGDVHPSHCEKLHHTENDQLVNTLPQSAVRRNGDVCNPAEVNSTALINNSNSSQLCIYGNVLGAHHHTHLSGAPLPQKLGCASTPCIHHHQIPTAKMSTMDGGPISKSDHIETTHPLVHSHPPSLEPNGVICSPAAVYVPSLKVSKVSKTVTFASPPAIESRERRLCSFRTTPHPGMPQKGVIQEGCMGGVKGRLEFGTDGIKTGQNFSTNAAVCNAVVTSSANTTTLSVIKTEHLEPVASTEVIGHEPSILQSEVKNSSASIKCKGQTAERISETAAGGNVETLSLRGHLQHHQNNRQTVTEFKGRAGIIFQEALLDQECTLYAHSLQRKLSTGSPSGRVDLDPIAKIFLEKDDAHFCPLVEQSFD